MSKKILQDGKGDGCWTALSALSEAKLSAAKGEGDGGVREVTVGAAALASVHARVAAFYSRSPTSQVDNSEEQVPRGVVGEGGRVAIDGSAFEEGDDDDSVAGGSDVPEDESESADAIEITTKPSPSPPPSPSPSPAADEDDLASFEKLAGLVPFVHTTTNTDSSFPSKRQRREFRDTVTARATGGQEPPRGGEWVKMDEMPQWPLGLMPGKTESFLFSLRVQQ
jgi:hypothetical protein